MKMKIEGMRAICAYIVPSGSGLWVEDMLMEKKQYDIVNFSFVSYFYM